MESASSVSEKNKKPTKNFEWNVDRLNSDEVVENRIGIGEYIKTIYKCDFNYHFNNVDSLCTTTTR